MKKGNLKKLTVCAVLIALATALSFVTIWEMPFGGSVTLLSMLPIVLIPILYGTGWGMVSAFLYSVIQLACSLGKLMSWGLTPSVFIGAVLLDYLVAFSLLGLAGLFRNKGFFGVMGGVSLVLVLRFTSHFLSGVILWANFEEFVAFGHSWVNHPALYSLCYNGMFMLPELALTLIGAAVLYKTGTVDRLRKETAQ